MCVCVCVRACVRACVCVCVYNVSLSLSLSLSLSSYSLSLAGNSGRLTWVFSCVQTMVWLPVFGVFNVPADVDACDCTQRLYGHRKRVYTAS